MQLELEDWNFNIKIPEGVQIGCRYAVEESEIAEETEVYLEAKREVTVDDLVDTIERRLLAEDKLRTKRLKCHVIVGPKEYEFTVEYQEYASMWGYYYQQIAKQFKL